MLKRIISLISSPNRKIRRFWDGFFPTYKHFVHTATKPFNIYIWQHIVNLSWLDLSLALQINNYISGI